MSPSWTRKPLTKPEHSKRYKLVMTFHQLFCSSFWSHRKKWNKVISGFLLHASTIWKHSWTSHHMSVPCSLPLTGSLLWTTERCYFSAQSIVQYLQAAVCLYHPLSDSCQEVFSYGWNPQEALVFSEHLKTGAQTEKKKTTTLSIKDPSQKHVVEDAKKSSSTPKC